MKRIIYALFMEAVKGKMIIYRLKLIACDAQKILLLLHQMVITSSLWLIPTPYRASSITLTWAGTISIKKRHSTERARGCVFHRITYLTYSSKEA